MEVKFTGSKTTELVKKFKTEVDKVVMSGKLLNNDEMIAVMNEKFTKQEITAVAFGLDGIIGKILMETIQSKVKQQNDISFQ